jgi:hypothetical protein
LEQNIQRLNNIVNAELKKKNAERISYILTDGLTEKDVLKGLDVGCFEMPHLCLIVNHSEHSG